MKIILNNKEYPVRAEHNSLVSSIEDMLPLKLNLSRSADHEYYTSLPYQANTDGAVYTDYVKAGWIYYFKDWNAFALNYKDMDISPYKVYMVGEVIGDIESVLISSGSGIEIEIIKDSRSVDW